MSRPKESVTFEMGSVRIRVDELEEGVSKYWLVIGHAGIELKKGDWGNLVQLLDEDEVANAILGVETEEEDATLFTAEDGSFTLSSEGTAEFHGTITAST